MLSALFESRVLQLFDARSCGHQIITKHEFADALESENESQRHFALFLWQEVFDTNRNGCCSAGAYIGGLSTLLTDDARNKEAKSLFEDKIDASCWSEFPSVVNKHAVLLALKVVTIKREGGVEEEKGLDSQAGGHKGDAAMKIVGSSILKPLNFTEWIFYENARGTNLGLYKFIPQYRGKMRTETGDWLKLENLTRGMSEPRILDLKVGSNSIGHTKAGVVKRTKQTIVHTVR